MRTYKYLSAMILIGLLGVLPARADIVPQTDDPTNSDTYQGWVDNSDGHLSGTAITGEVWSGDGADLPQARFIYLNEANFPDTYFRYVLKHAKASNFISRLSVSGFEVFKTPTFKYNENVAESAADNLFTEAELQSVTAFSPRFVNEAITGRSISDLTGIEFFTALKQFYSSTETDVERLPFLGEQLEALSVGSCPILVEFDPSVYPNLQWFDIGYTAGSERITSIDLSRNQALIGFRINHFPALSEVNVSGLSTLEQLAVKNNPSLQEIDLQDNLGLKRVGLIGDALQSLDVSVCTELEVLGCPSNQITHLDVSNNTKLYALIVSGNRLTDLDVSGLTLLGSVASADESAAFSYKEQQRDLQAEGIEVDGTKYYYFRLDDSQSSAAGQSIVERMTATNFMNTPSQFDPARATWVSGGTVINDTNGSQAPAKAAPADLFDGPVLLLEPTSEENGVASGTVTYTYDVNYNGVGADPAEVFTLNWTARAEQVPTGIVNVNDARHGEVVGRRYFMPDGKEGDVPFKGVNIVVTRYGDGTQAVGKVVR